MNAIEHLIEEHDTIRDLFDQFEDAGDRAYKAKKDIADSAIEEILMNAKEEEEILFPALEGKVDKDTHEMVLELVAEHRATDFMIEQIQQTRPEDETFSPKFKAMMESLRHHYEEEEEDVFPEAESALSEDELEELGEQMDGLERRAAA
jgi:hemerythrin-like domain-containing protein